MKYTKFIALTLLAMCLFAQNTLSKDSDEPLAEGEEFTEEELQEREDEEEELRNAKNEFFTRETFFAEYDQANPQHVEVKMAKKYFPTRTTSIDKLRYKSLLKMYMDGTVHDEEIDEDIREAAHEQIEGFVEQYVNETSADKDEFFVEDLFLDFIDGKFHDWVEKTHPDEQYETNTDL